MEKYDFAIASVFIVSPFSEQRREKIFKNY